MLAALLLVPAFAGGDVALNATMVDPSDGLSPHGRSLTASEGCQNCCTNHDCRLAFSMTSPGTCCGAHPQGGQLGCCPQGASCVFCATRWKCTRSAYVTRSQRCSVCADDRPYECMRSTSYHSYGHHYSSFGMIDMLFSVMVFTIAGVAIYQCCLRSQQQQVVYAQPAYGQPVGQPGMMGGPGMVMGGPVGYGGGMGVAGGAAAGFVGGMLVGEALDHGDGGYHGGGGGYYEGGGGGEDFGGGGGFDADQ